MVYCGKPSGGCSACRKRKVLCDQQEPACGGCVRRHQICPGYRNLIDLHFRDETQHVIKKATNSRGRAAKVHAANEQRTFTTAQSSASSSTYSDAEAKNHESESVPNASSTARRLQPKPVVVTAPTPPPETVDDGCQEEFKHSETQATPMPKTRKSYSKRSRQPRCTASALLGAFASDTAQSSVKQVDLVFNYYNPELDRDMETPYHTMESVVADEAYSSDRNTPSPRPDNWPNSILTPSVCKRGVNRFFAQYVSIEDNCHQSYDFIRKMWKPPCWTGNDVSDSIDGVSASIIAVGLSSLSKLKGCQETMTQARHCYAIALMQLQKALRDPSHVADDATMLIVLILGTYEFLAGRNPQTMSAWQSHINGASALVNRRGPTQFDTEAGIRMFLMLCHGVLVNCLQSGLPFPPALIEWRRGLVERNEEQQQSWLVADPIYRALQARYDIKCGIIKEVDEIVQSLTEIDIEFAALLSAMPETCQYRTVKFPYDHAAVFGHSCHVYPNQRQVTIWNGLRTVRILLHETILEHLYTHVSNYPPSLIPHHYLQLLAKTMKMLDMLGDAIIASIPQHFGVVSSRKAPTGKQEGASPISEQDSPYRRSPSRIASRDVSPSKQLSSMLGSPTPGLTLLHPVKAAAPSNRGGTAETFMTVASVSNTILWPLYVLGTSSSCSSSKREYVMDRLDAIWQETKLEQALSIAELLASSTNRLTDQGLLDRLPALSEGVLCDIV